MTFEIFKSYFCDFKYIFSAVKFGRMSKKQRDQLYVEVIRHQNSVQSDPSQEAYLAQYANMSPLNYMQPNSYAAMAMRNRKMFIIFIIIFKDDFSKAKFLNINFKNNSSFNVLIKNKFSKIMYSEDFSKTSQISVGSFFCLFLAVIFPGKTILLQFGFYIRKYFFVCYSEVLFHKLFSEVSVTVSDKNGSFSR